MEILANPSELRMVAQRLQQASSSLTEMDSTIGAVYGQLGWEAREKAQVDGQVSQARTRAGHLAGQVADLARALAGTAQMLEDADRRAAVQWEGVGTGFEAILRQWMTDPGGQLLNIPWESVARILGLGGLLGAVPSIVSWLGASGTEGPRVPPQIAQILTLLEGALKPFLGAKWLRGARSLEFVFDAAGFLPAGIALDYLSRPHEPGQEERDGIASATSGVLQELAAHDPYVAAALLVNAGVQLGGPPLVWAEGQLRSIITDPEMRRNLDEMALTGQDVENADITNPIYAAGVAYGDYVTHQWDKLPADVLNVPESLSKTFAGVDNLGIKLVTGVPSHIVAGVDNLVANSALPQWTKEDFHAEANHIIVTAGGVGEVGHGLIEIVGPIPGVFGMGGNPGQGVQDVVGGGGKIVGGVAGGVGDVGKGAFDAGRSILGWAISPFSH